MSTMLEEDNIDKFVENYFREQEEFWNKYSLKEYLDWLVSFMARKGLTGFNSENAGYELIFDADDSERDIEMANDLNWLFDHIERLCLSLGGRTLSQMPHGFEEHAICFQYQGQCFEVTLTQGQGSIYAVVLCDASKDTVDITAYVDETLTSRVVGWTENWFHDNGRETAVIGISGGKDSAVVAGICERALGAENVYGIMMPNGEQKDIGDSLDVVASLGIRSGICNIDAAYQAICDCVQQATGIPISDAAAINVGPRVRMAVLYAIAQTLSDTRGAHACVVGTGNRAEAEVGYTTKWGDSACDVNPIRNLWVKDVLEVGDALDKVPSHIVHKAPADGLCGQTDEERLGVSYEDVRRVCVGDKSVPQTVQDRVYTLQERSQHKRTPVPYFLNF